MTSVFVYYGRLFIQRSGRSLNFEQFCHYNTNCISFFVFVSLTHCLQRCLMAPTSSVLAKLVLNHYRTDIFKSCMLHFLISESHPN